MPRKNQKRALPPRTKRMDQDETFAYIAGYTEAGFAFGVTWEEWEQFNQRHLLDPETDSNTSLNDDPPELPF